MFRIICYRNLIRSTCLRCCYSTQLPKITLPKSLSEDGGLKLTYKKFRQHNDKLYTGKIFHQGSKKIPVITSKFRPNLNHYYNQRYRKDKNILLASDGWLRGLKYDGDVIKFMPFESNEFYKKEHFKEEEEPVAVSFKSLGIRNELCENLKEFFNAKVPNEAQVKTIPNILANMNVRCCFETGTGKTFAYAVPLIEKILISKESAKEAQSTDNIDSNSNIKEPKALIIVPSRELGYQTFENLKKLTQGLDIGLAPIFGGKPLNFTHSGYDIVITTMGMFQSNLRKKMYSIDKIKHLIIDEVDTMCDSSFSKELSDLLHKFSFVNPDNENACQLVLVSATFPEYVNNVIEDFIDIRNIVVATSKKVNHILFHIKHVFYRINRLTRNEKLLELCYQFEKDPGQTIIFVNRTPAAVFVEKFLNSNHFDCIALIKQKSNADKRFYNFLDFQAGKIKFMVSTDLGSRGLDTRNVQHIINFDCPRFENDYVHRTGRSGRMNSTNAKCSVHTFVSFKPDVYLVQNLERSIRENKAIEGINLDVNNFYREKFASRKEDEDDDENYINE